MRSYTATGFDPSEIPLTPTHADWDNHWVHLGSNPASPVYRHRREALVIKLFPRDKLRHRLHPPHSRTLRAHLALRRMNIAAPELLACGGGHPGYAVFRYIEGIGLGSLCTRILPLYPQLDPWRDELLAHIGSSVGRLHKLGWVHGDLQPDNILVSPCRDPSTALIDNTRTRRPLPWRGYRERHRNIAQLLMLPPKYLDSAARLLLLEAYQKQFPCADEMLVSAQHRAEQRRSVKYSKGQWEGDLTPADQHWLKVMLGEGSPTS